MSWGTRQPAYPGELSTLLNIFRMRNRETGLKVIATTGGPGAKNATSVTRDWHLLENDQGTSPTGIPDERRRWLLLCFLHSLTHKPRGLALIPTPLEAPSSGVRLTPRVQPIYSNRNHRASLAARADIFAFLDIPFFSLRRDGGHEWKLCDRFAILSLACILSSI